MDMGFDHTAWPIGPGRGADAGAKSVGAEARLDWHGLRARFLAARAFRQAAEVGGQAGDMAVGASFDRSAARVLADFDDASHGVNQRDSADGKDASGIDEHVAGASMRGDRG
jgi:hypothetical protein